MVLGSLVTAAAAYAFQALGGRSLGPEAFAPISALWTTLFIALSVFLVPLEQFATREASLGRHVLSEHRVALGVAGSSAAVAATVFVYVTRATLFDGRELYALQMLLLVAGYTVFLVGKGILAGRRRFTWVGVVLGGEGLLRLVVASLVLVLASSAANLAWAMVIAPLSVFFTTTWWHRSRSETTPGAAGSAHPFLGPYIVGSAASQILLAGAPLAVVAIGGTNTQVSILFVTFTLFRAPLTLIYSLQSRLIPEPVRMAAVEDQTDLRQLGWRLSVLGLVTAGVGAVGAWFVGGAVVSLLFGADFGPSSAVAAFAAAGVIAASTAQIVGQILVARARTALLATAWGTGLGIATAALVLLPGSPDTVVAASFVIGELVALALVSFFTAVTGKDGDPRASGTEHLDPEPASPEER
jgi:O-antigen/teichoic acid export membrane protein